MGADRGAGVVAQDAVEAWRRPARLAEPMFFPGRARMCPRGPRALSGPGKPVLRQPRSVRRCSNGRRWPSNAAPTGRKCAGQGANTATEKLSLPSSAVVDHTGQSGRGARPAARPSSQAVGHMQSTNLRSATVVPPLGMAGAPRDGGPHRGSGSELLSRFSVLNTPAAPHGRALPGDLHPGGCRSAAARQVSHVSTRAEAGPTDKG